MTGIPVTVVGVAAPARYGDGMPRVLRTALIAVVAVVVLVVGGIVVGAVVGTGGDDDPSDARTTTPAATTTAPDVPLDEVDTSTVAVARTEFCGDVAPEAAEAALGEAPSDTTTYADGQSAQVTGTVRDIAHEFGCGWSTPRANARAWVFAPPVTRRAARELVADARAEDGCSVESNAPAFGEPSVALTCRTGRGVQASFRGLFGDAWLTCTVAARLEPAEALERADRWCVAVLAAARA